MRALSLWQPWATLIALGVKEYETRHWKPNGDTLKIGDQLAIHASKTDDLSVYSGRNSAYFLEALIDGGYFERLASGGATPVKSLPLGKILCVVEVVDFVRSQSVFTLLSERERAFGNWEIGRWGWQLKLIEVYPEPIPARGQQGIWEWVDTRDMTDEQRLKAHQPKATNIMQAGKCPSCKRKDTLYFYQLDVPGHYFGADKPANEDGKLDGGYWCAKCDWSNAGSFKPELIGKS